LGVDYLGAHIKEQKTHKLKAKEIIMAQET